YRVVPVVVEVDRLTGDAQWVEVSGARTVREHDVENKHWVSEYVQTRERYLWGVLALDFDRVMSMSDDAVGHEYSSIYDRDNAASLDKILGSGTERRIKLVSVTLPPGEPGRAVVRFERTTIRNGVASGP